MDERESIVASSQFESVTTNQPLADDGQEKMDFLGFLRRRKSFIILLGLLGVGVGYLIFKKQNPVFRSTTRVQVIHQSSDPRLQTMLAEKDLSGRGLRDQESQGDRGRSDQWSAERPSNAEGAES